MPLVGTNVPMAGGRAKVAGALRYIANLEFDGMLHVKALRSPYAHARIQSIEPGAAEQLSGVSAIVTRDDLKGWSAVHFCKPLSIGIRLRSPDDFLAD